MCQENNDKKISGDYIAGFVDGEGCFSLTMRKDKEKYFNWKALFAIELREDDKNILNLIKEYFNCGSISLSSRGMVRYQISNASDLLDIIVPFFSLHCLIGKKGSDFILWKEAIEIINKNKKKKTNSIIGKKGFVKNNWNKDDLDRLNEIRKEMLLFKCNNKNRVFKYGS